MGGEHDRADLLEAAELATWVGAIARSMSWLGAVGHVPPAQRGDWRDAVPGWLEELLER